MGNAVRHRAPGRQAQPPPRSCPNGASGGAAPLPGLPLLPQPLRTGVTHPALGPGTGRICHRAAPSQMAAGTLQGSPGGSSRPPGQPRPVPCPVPPQPWGSRHPAGCSRARSLPPRTLLRLLALRGARGWAVGTASPNSPWTATADPAIKLGTSPSQCFSNCSTHARHAHCYFNVSWTRVAAPHQPSRTRAPPRPPATPLPALASSEQKLTVVGDRRASL